MRLLRHTAVKRGGVVTARTLLSHMSHLMHQQPLPLCRPGRADSLRQHEVSSDGKRLCTDPCQCLPGTSVVVDANLAKVVPECRPKRYA